MEHCGHIAVACLGPFGSSLSPAATFYTCVYEYIEIFFDIFMAAWGLDALPRRRRGVQQGDSKGYERESVSITLIVLQKKGLLSCMYKSCA